MPVAPVEIMDRRFTRADLADLPDDGRRYELIDGGAHERRTGAPADLVRWPPVA